MRAQRVHVLLERELDELDRLAAPELPLERARARLNRPGPVTQWLVATKPVQEEPQVPVGHRVAEEEKMAASQLGGESDRYDAGHLRLGRIVDVVVLHHDEALPLALGRPVDLSVQLEDDRASLERQLRC